MRNTSRALALADGKRPLVLLEDDGACAKDWLGRARRAARVLAERHGDRFVLALYAAYRLPRDMTVVPYHPSNFYGNVALWLAPGTAVDLAVRMREASERASCPPSDIVTRQLVWAGTPAYMHSPSLVQHLGDVSTRGSFRVIRAQSFRG